MKSDKTATVDINPIYKNYTDKIATIPSARKVLLLQDEEGPVVWTIIEAPPFEDSLRIPIYEVESEILRDSAEEVLIDFHLLNLSEYSHQDELLQVISPGATVIWQR